MLPCNPKIGVRFSHIVLWGHLLLMLCVMGLSIFFLPPLYDIRTFQLYIQIFLISPLVLLVAYLSVSFYGHLHYMSNLMLYMSYAVDFWCLMTKLVQGLF